MRPAACRRPSRPSEPDAVTPQSGSAAGDASISRIAPRTAAPSPCAIAVGRRHQRQDRRRALDRPPAPVHRLQERLLTAAAAAQHRPQRPGELLDREPDVEREQVVLDRLVLAQPPEVLGAVVPDLHPLLAIDHGDPDAERGEDRLEEVVDPVEVAGPVAQLVVDRLELLVGRLELLVHRLELLVGRLELLVGGLELLVGRLQLLVGGLELVDRRLQLLVGELEVAPVGLELPPHGGVAADVLEHDADAVRRAAVRQQRRHRHLEHALVALARREPLLAERHAAALAHRLVDRPAQLARLLRELELVQRAPDLLGPDAEQRARRQVGERQRAAARHDELRVRPDLERRVAAGAVDLHGGSGSGVPVRHAGDARLERRAAVELAEDPPLEVDRREDVAVRDHHLRLAEHQQAVVAQREVEVTQHATLRLGREVHERVAADQQVQPRDRRVGDEVVAAEDHRPAQVLAERESLIGALEVLRAQLLRDRLGLLLGVQPEPRGRQRRPRRRRWRRSSRGRGRRPGPAPPPARPRSCTPPARSRSPRTRRGSRRPASLPASSSGITSSWRCCHAGGSRKNSVTLMSSVSKSCSYSSGWTSRWSR